ncbi:MAG: GNAT family N-acetyltransferase [Anaerolineae bacterium]|nr:GNAT family N-acetyltransferase [Anaerolineae bacterium]
MHKMLLELPDRLETERLIIRPYQAGDGSAYYRLAQNNKAHLLPFEEGNPALAIQTEKDAEILMREFHAEWVCRNVFFVGGWEKATGTLVVQLVISVTHWDWRQFEIGYFVDKDHEGQGFVSEGVRAMLYFAFECLGAQRVSAGCNDTNVRSQHVIERSGFTREAHIRQSRCHIRCEDGTFSGDYHYGMLRAEYDRLPKPELVCQP